MKQILILHFVGHVKSFPINYHTYIILYLYIYIFRPGCKAQYNCLKIKNALGLRDRCALEAEAFSSQVMPKILYPGTFFEDYIN